MNQQLLFNKFNQGINWNALGYFIYKILSTALSFALYAKLSTDSFSSWANMNSVIFLSLLWLNCGFRKAIPRYSPEFAKNKQAMKTFIQSVIGIQIGILILATPLVVHFACTMAYLFNIGDCRAFQYFGIPLFLLEGTIALLRLIYHAYFWHKPFNILTTIVSATEMLMSLAFVFFAVPLCCPLPIVLSIKVAADVIIVIGGLIMLRKLYNDKDYPGDQTINTRLITKKFIKHAGIMWFNDLIKSLSERNFMLPLLTHLFGPVQGNIFKIANDGAQLFHRTIIKTIGTTDTALLSHVEVGQGSAQQLHTAFKQLYKTVLLVTVPLFAIVLTMGFFNEQLFSNPLIFNIFFIIAIGYVIEHILSPYERILEVKQRYLLLLISYTPYLLTLTYLFASPAITSLGLITTITIIHAVRLIGSFSMTYFTSTRYLRSTKT